MKKIAVSATATVRNENIFLVARTAIMCFCSSQDFENCVQFEARKLVIFNSVGNIDMRPKWSMHLAEEMRSWFFKQEIFYLIISACHCQPVPHGPSERRVRINSFPTSVYQQLLWVADAGRHPRRGEFENSGHGLHLQNVIGSNQVWGMEENAESIPARAGLRNCRKTRSFDLISLKCVVWIPPTKFLQWMIQLEFLSFQNSYFFF